MVTEDRYLRPWRAGQSRWLVLAVLVLTLRGESPPAAGQTPTAATRQASPDAARKLPAKRVRPDREPAVPALAQAPTEPHQPHGPADDRLRHAERAYSFDRSVPQGLPQLEGAAIVAGESGPTSPSGASADAGEGLTNAADGLSAPVDRPGASEEQAAPRVDAAALLAAARQHTDEAVRAGNQRNFALAREKFIEALQVLTLCHPNSDRASACWSEVLVALDEADDFVSAAGGLQPLAPRDVAAGHSSRAAAALPRESTPQEAELHYRRFAGQRLVAALAPSREASRALLGLGKVHALMADQSAPVRNGRTKAQFFYEAALRMDGANWRAANELGVLLARQNRFEEAAAFLRRSVAIEPRGDTLHNLAVALRGAGQEALAGEADRRAAELGYGGAATPVRPSPVSPAPAVEPSLPSDAPTETPVEATDESASSKGAPQPLRASDEAKSSSEWKAARVPGEESAAPAPADKAKPVKKTASQRGLFWWIKPNW